MITPKTYYEATCDKCGARLEIDGICAWQTRDEAKDAILTFGWISGGGKVICDECKMKGE